MSRSSNTANSNRKNQHILKRAKDHGWNGPNVTPGGEFEDILSGDPFGTKESGGILHFKNIE